MMIEDAPAFSAQVYVEHNITSHAPGSGASYEYIKDAVQAVIGEVAQPNNLRSSWRFPNQSVLSINQATGMVEYRTAKRELARETALDEFAGHSVMQRIAQAYPLQPAAALKRSGYDHDAANPSSSGYELRISLSRSQLNALSHTDKQLALATGQACLSVLFGEGIVGDGFALNQRAHGINRLNDVKTAVHGQKSMQTGIWADELGEYRVDLQSGNASLSSERTELYIASAKLLTRLVANNTTPLARTLPRAVDPVGALKLVSKDLTLRRAIELRDNRFSTITAVDYCGLLGELGLEYDQDCFLPPDELNAARYLALVPSELEGINLAHGEFNDLDETFPWAYKLRRLLKLADGDLAKVNRDNNRAVMYDLSSSVLGGAVEKYWQAQQADPGFTTRNLQQRLSAAA